MSQKISILQEEPEDHTSVYRVHQLAFHQEDESRLIERLRLSDEFIPELSLVAKNGRAAVVGSILFTQIRIAGTFDFPALALAPMAVLPEYQRSGIGHLLINAGLARGRELGYESVIVLGHKDYYQKFGFRPASGWNIRCPFEVPDEAFMALELRKGALAHVSGTVRYSPAFNL